MREMHTRRELHGPPLELMLRIGPCEELYDTEADPHEVVNLVGSTNREHLAAFSRLRSALDNWMAETGDRGSLHERGYNPVAVEKEMHEWFGTPAWYRPLDPSPSQPASPHKR
jgi:N-sulfoglucosamine sulfohydrolase